jgi:hypothetical protein
LHGQDRRVLDRPDDDPLDSHATQERYVAPMVWTGTVTEIFPAFSKVSVREKFPPAVSGFFSPIIQGEPAAAAITGV